MSDLDSVSITVSGNTLVDAVHEDDEGYWRHYRDGTWHYCDPRIQLVWDGEDEYSEDSDERWRDAMSLEWEDLKISHRIEISLEKLQENTPG